MDETRTLQTRRPRRLKLLAWAHNTRHAGANLEPSSATQAEALMDKVHAEIEAVDSSMKDLAAEREALSAQVVRGKEALASSRRSLAQAAKALRHIGAAARRSARQNASEVFWLDCALGCAAQDIDEADGANPPVDAMLASEAFLAHARLARLFASFRQPTSLGMTTLETASAHLCSVRLLQEAAASKISFLLSQKEAIESEHCLGLAYHACARGDASTRANQTRPVAMQRQLQMKRAEAHLRKAVSCASDPGSGLPPSAQADIHRDLAALYLDMARTAEVGVHAAVSSCQSAGQLHLCMAADKYAACKLHGMETQVMCAAGEMLLGVQDWEGAMINFARALQAALKNRNTVRRQSRRGTWRSALGTRVYATAVAMPSGGGKGEGAQRRVAAEDRAALSVREAATGLMESLVRRGRSDEALLLTEVCAYEDSEQTLRAIDGKRSPPWGESVSLLQNQRAHMHERGRAYAGQPTDTGFSGACVSAVPKEDAGFEDMFAAAEAPQPVDAGAVEDGGENVWQDVDIPLFGGHGSVLVEQLLEGSCSAETCVVILHLHPPACAADRLRLGVDDAAGEAANCFGGYAWVMRGGERVEARGSELETAGKMPSGHAPQTERSSCVCYSRAETTRIVQAADALRLQCADFQGVFVGAVEYGRHYSCVRCPSCNLLRARCGPLSRGTTGTMCGLASI